MNESHVAQEVEKMWHAELRVLPIIAGITSVVCAVVWFWRLDQWESGAFFMGLLAGGLLTSVFASLVFVVRLGRTLRGGLPAGLLVDAVRLVRGK